MNRCVLSNFYKTRNKPETISENNVILERFITNTYLKKHLTQQTSVAEIGAGIRAYSPEIIKYAEKRLAIDLFQENLDRLQKHITSLHSNKRFTLYK